MGEILDGIVAFARPKGSSRSHCARRSRVTLWLWKLSGSQTYDASTRPAGPPCTQLSAMYTKYDGPSRGWNETT
eukprot:CAMPEP_0181238952 /NCGR_PEP_ID=MMETSP1096-20121128/39648_1 /TAXON_ID=156174 ORGANISM="Chrysochromulina ericina, Strain CCMP281" /NCGR_SAMPLE_ID=MMETSP1096 /ASSEMBLY_ACC=CAM_ASM_000453 /LENGTH=73 /DNA_ID=CAMNT_0023334563 /DNA_START=139 /DNA_END=360 /DNA_ORIENTATION=-